MKTKPLILSKITFLLMSTFLFVSCQKEESEVVDVHRHSKEQNYSRSNINFEDFKANFLDKHENKIRNHFLPHGNKGGDDYILDINTDRIVEFTNDSVSTYTLNVVTSDQDYESFTNLIYFENNNNVGEVIMKYTPTAGWLSELSNGNKLPFSGTLSIMSSDGEVMQTDEFVDGVPQGRPSPCVFSAFPIWVDCHGSDCPCTDGGGYFGGWSINSSCGGMTGGGGGSGGGSGGGAGGGGGGTGGGSGNGGGDLPTDPIEWALFMKLSNMMGPEDYFILPSPVTPHPDFLFDNFNQFETFISNYSLDNIEVLDIQDGTHNTSWTLSNNIGPDIQFIINSTLCNNNTGQQYQLNSLMGFLTNNDSYGLKMNLNHFYYNGVNSNNLAEINIYFEWGIDTQIGFIPVHIMIRKHYLIEIDIYSGWVMNTTEID